MSRIMPFSIERKPAEQSLEKVTELRGEVSEMKRELDRLSADVRDQQRRLAKLVTWLAISICMCGISVLVIAIKL